MNPLVTVAALGVAGLALTGAGVAPQLSARLLGDEVMLRVAPVDPIDPLRGAYVDLGYPDLRPHRGGAGDSGELYVVLEQQGRLWVATDWARHRPEGGTYLACDDRDGSVVCGIESWFLPQDEAAAMEKDLADGAVATVRVDSRGHAALMSVDAG